MENKNPRSQRPRRSFTPEFKAEIVELCRRGDRSISQVSRDFDLTETAVRARVNQAAIGVGEREGLTSEESEELSKLRRENRSQYRYEINGGVILEISAVRCAEREIEGLTDGLFREADLKATYQHRLAS